MTDKQYRLVATWPKQMMRAPKRWPMRNKERAMKGLRDLLEGIEIRKNKYYIGSDLTIESRPTGPWVLDEEATSEAYDVKDNDE